MPANISHNAFFYIFFYGKIRLNPHKTYNFNNFNPIIAEIVPSFLIIFVLMLLIMDGKNMNKKILFLLTVLSIALAACSREQGKPVFVATINPVASIVREIVGQDVEVVCLTSPGDSPHTFNPTPSQMMKIESAKAFFYVADNLDNWVASVSNKNRIELIRLFPADCVLSFEEDSHDEEGHSEDGHNHDSGADPHFWTDPVTVKTLVPLIVEALISIDPDNSKKYVDNSVKFVEKLDSLDKQVRTMLSGVQGRPVLLFHPSFRYFLKRYGLKYIGSVEPSPGKESSPKFLAEIVSKLNAEGAKAVFTEPQLPPNAAKAVAEATGVKVWELDPIGGSPGKQSYFDLIMYNAKILRDALQ